MIGLKLKLKIGLIRLLKSDFVKAYDEAAADAARVVVVNGLIAVSGVAS